MIRDTAKVAIIHLYWPRPPSSLKLAIVLRKPRGEREKERAKTLNMEYWEEAMEGGKNICHLVCGQNFALYI